MQETKYLRWEGDCRANPTPALLQRQMGGIVSGARWTAEGILLDVTEAPVADLLLLSFCLA